MPRQAGNTKAPARRAGAAKSGASRKKSTTTKQTPRKRSAAKQEDTAARYFELTGIIMIALALLFGVCLYTPYGGYVGEAVRYVLVGLFGYASMTVPVFVAGCAVYLMVRRDYNRMYIKLSLSILIMLCVSILWQTFGQTATNSACLRLSRWRTEQEAGAACSGQ